MNSEGRPKLINNMSLDGRSRIVNPMSDQIKNVHEF